MDPNEPDAPPEAVIFVTAACVGIILWLLSMAG